MLNDFLTSFLLGLATPLTAVCVIPLYPGFIAYLANRYTTAPSKKTMVLLGAMVALGVIIFMLLLGIIFTTLLQQSLTNVIGILSPIAFGILFFIGFLLLFNVDFSRYLPHLKTPEAKNPLFGAFLYGLFFGAIIIPCNPALIAAFFAKTLVAELTTVAANLVNTFLFGLGIGTPLLLLTIVSGSFNTQLIRLLTQNKKIINIVTGVILVAISAYYLLTVFRIFG